MESPHGDPTTPRGRACPSVRVCDCQRVRVCACLGRRGAQSWTGRQEDRETGRTARHTEQNRPRAGIS